MRRILVGAIALVLLGAGTCVSAEESKPEQIEGLSFNAEQIKLDQKTNTLLLKGKAQVSYAAKVARADQISVARDTKVTRLAGHVQIITAEQIVSADEAELDIVAGKLEPKGNVVIEDRPTKGDANRK